MIAKVTMEPWLYPHVFSYKFRCHSKGHVSLFFEAPSLSKPTLSSPSPRNKELSLVEKPMATWKCGGEARTSHQGEPLIKGDKTFVYLGWFLCIMTMSTVAFVQHIEPAWQPIDPRWLLGDLALEMSWNCHGPKTTHGPKAISKSWPGMGTS